jgi:hypothetical protein
MSALGNGAANFSEFKADAVLPNEVTTSAASNDSLKSSQVGGKKGKRSSTKKRCGKGSKEMKEKMARLRAMRKQNGGNDNMPAIPPPPPLEEAPVPPGPPVLKGGNKCAMQGGKKVKGGNPEGDLDELEENVEAKVGGNNVDVPIENEESKANEYKQQGGKKKRRSAKRTAKKGKKGSKKSTKKYWLF